MKRTLTALLASACIVGAFENPAHSADALWKRTDLWIITGHTETSTCVAQNIYEDGTHLLISFDGSAWNMGLGGVDATDGTSEAEVYVEFDRGQTFRAHFIEISDELFVARDLKESFVGFLAVSSTITIDGLGKYNLKGSAEAIKETLICQSALSESRISRAWEPKPTDVGV